MAITKQQQPTTPNQANADLLYVLTSTNTNQPQFQFVMEVSDGTDTFTFKQQPCRSYYTSSIAPTGGGADFGGLQHALTNSPLTQSIRDDEYQTISIINGNFDGSDTNAQDIYYIQVNVYNSAGSNIQNFGWFNLSSNGGGPRTTDSQEWGDVFSGVNDSNRLLHIAVGPKNFEDAGNTLNANWYSYKVTLVGQESAGIEDNGAQYAQKWFTKQTAECDYNGTRFAFLNELGGWDYFTFPYADSKSDNITRQTYNQTFVNYSSNVTYDKSRRGSKVYSISYQESRVAESDFLSQSEADWLRELVESPEVYVQSGTDFLPVVVEDTAFTYKTNPRTQKLYRLTLRYRMANTRRC